MQWNWKKQVTKELNKMLNFKINSDEIDKIGNFTKEEKNFRLKNLDYLMILDFQIKKMKIGNFRI